MLQLYNILVRPHFEFGVQLCSPYNTKAFGQAPNRKGVEGRRSNAGKLD